MHSYSIDTDCRKKVIVIIMIISFILNSLLYHSLNYLINFVGEKIPLFFDLITLCDNIGLSINQFSVLGIFGLIYLFYSQFLWKAKKIKKLHHILDLNGEWSGGYSSSYVDENGQGKEGGCSVIIKQNWNKISIKCNFGESSSSYSKTASLYVDDIEGNTLTFTYINDSKSPNWEIRKHDGCNIFHCGDGVLEGKYFTDRGNGTHGTIQLIKTASINEEVNTEKEIQLK